MNFSLHVSLRMILEHVSDLSVERLRQCLHIAIYICVYTTYRLSRFFSHEGSIRDNLNISKETYFLFFGIFSYSKALI